MLDSPLPSPSRNIPAYLDSTSEGSDDSDSVGEIDDNEASGDQLHGIIEDLMRHERSTDSDQDVFRPSNNQGTSNDGQLAAYSSESESNSDDGFGEGDVDTKAVETNNSEMTKQALSLILGGLSSYTCASEENSRLSAGSDDPGTAGSSHPAAETLLTDRPFGGVTMDTTLTKRDCPEPENQDQIEDTKEGDSECCQQRDDCDVRLEIEDDVTDDVNTDSLQS